MGYNRSGHTRKLKIRRRRKEEARLARKAAAAAPTAPTEGVVAKAAGLAKAAVHKVGEAVQSVVEKVKGKSE